MTQTNTTQNKEELEEVRWRQRLQGWLEQVNLLEQKPNVQGGQLVFKGTRVTLTSLINFIIDVRDKSLSQAHQSGIEEERKRIIKIITDKFLLTLDLNTWTAESAKSEALFNNSKEIKNWNKAMNILLESLKGNKQ